MKGKKTVVHLISSLGSGGCENMLLRTLPKLDPSTRHVVITLLYPGELNEKFNQQGIESIDIGLRSFFDLPRLRYLVAKIKELEPALILTYLFHADVIGRLYLQKRIKAPLIPFLRTTYNSGKYWPANLFQRLTKGMVQHYLANSEAIKDYYQRHFGVSPDKITVIFNGLDQSVFDQAKPEKIVNELGLPRDRIVVTCVANLVANKGHRFLLEAFEHFWCAHPNAVLLLVGTGPEDAALKQQVQPYQSRANIRFLGRRADVPDILAATDFFVFPTQFEGMSNAILEAMAAGAAVITTDIPENRAFLDHEKTALLVKTEDSGLIVQAMERLVADFALRRRLLRAAKEYIYNHQSLAQVVKQWNGVINTYAHQS